MTVLRVPREIMAAWRGEDAAPDKATGDARDDDDPPATESITRVG